MGCHARRPRSPSLHAKLGRDLSSQEKASPQRRGDSLRHTLLQGVLTPLPSCVSSSVMCERAALTPGAPFPSWFLSLNMRQGALHDDAETVLQAARASRIACVASDQRRSFPLSSLTLRLVVSNRMLGCAYAQSMRVLSLVVCTVCQPAARRLGSVLSYDRVIVPLSGAPLVKKTTPTASSSSCPRVTFRVLGHRFFAWRPHKRHQTFFESQWKTSTSSCGTYTLRPPVSQVE